MERAISSVRAVRFCCGGGGRRGRRSRCAARHGASRHCFVGLGAGAGAGRGSATAADAAAGASATVTVRGRGSAREPDAGLPRRGAAHAARAQDAARLDAGRGFLPRRSATFVEIVRRRLGADDGVELAQRIDLLGHDAAHGGGAGPGLLGQLDDAAGQFGAGGFEFAADLPWRVCASRRRSR